MVLVHGLLVILDSRRFSSVEFRRFVGIYAMGELKLIGLVEIHRQVVRRQLARGTPANKEIIIYSQFVPPHSVRTRNVSRQRLLPESSPDRGKNC